jgi:hypothetical protein
MGGAVGSTEFLQFRKKAGHLVNLIIGGLTDRGVVEARRVYESPYDGIAPEGPERSSSGRT